MKSRARRSSSVTRPRLAVVVPSPLSRARRSSRAFKLTCATSLSTAAKDPAFVAATYNAVAYRPLVPNCCKGACVVPPASQSQSPPPIPPPRAHASPSRPSPSSIASSNFPRTFTSPPLAPFALAVAYVRCEASSSVSPRASRSNLRARRRASPSRVAARFASRRIARISSRAFAHLERRSRGRASRESSKHRVVRVCGSRARGSTAPRGNRTRARRRARNTKAKAGARPSRAAHARATASARDDAHGATTRAHASTRALARAMDARRRRKRGLRLRDRDPRRARGQRHRRGAARDGRRDARWARWWAGKR